MDSLQAYVTCFHPLCRFIAWIHCVVFLFGVSDVCFDQLVDLPKFNNKSVIAIAIIHVEMRTFVFVGYVK